jgi:hypothetical protein
MKTNVEYRNITQKFRVSDDGEAAKITGYAALVDVSSDPFGMWNEIIDPHAFDSVMASNPDVRALWNHNPDHVLGRTSANTLTLSLDARGLAYVIDPPDTTLARDLIVSMRRKDVTQSSFGFITKRDQWTDNADGTVTRRILEFEELLDVSPVTYPAYSLTTSQVRNLPASMPAEMRSRFEAHVATDATKSTRSLTEHCTCACAQCLDESCGICSADPQCLGAERNSALWQTDTMLRLRIAEAL